MGVGRAGRAVRVSMWEIASDPTEQGALLLRDEEGAARFSSRDGGRTWVPFAGACERSAMGMGDAREANATR